MNNPIIVTDKSLSYYDTRLKGYIGTLYGTDMTVEWEPLENGKNLFKLKIALKNKHGAELFSKIVDFPLEQTIVSGDYNDEGKSLILYFQDGTSTSVPIGDLIEGLASKLDLEGKASLGTCHKDAVSSYVKAVPSGSSSYAKISKVGGASKKCSNIYNVGIGYAWQLDCVKQSDGTVVMTRTGSGGVAYFNAYVISLTAGKTYTFRYSGSGVELVQLVKQSGDSVITTFYGKAVYTPSQTENYFLRVYMSNSKTSVGDTASVNLWINEGDVTLPYEPSFSGIRSAKVTEIVSVDGYGNTVAVLPIPQSVQSLEGYGQGNPNNPEEYNYIDFENQKFITVGRIVDDVWTVYNSSIKISIPKIIGVEGGGAVKLENQYGYSVPCEVAYYSDGNSTLIAEEFIGDLKGTAEAARYYDVDGAPSSKTIKEVLDQVLNGVSPLKVTAESIGVLATSNGQSQVRGSGIISNPPISSGNIVIDKYVESGASYLCFWQVSSVDTANITLTPLSNIYVGGGNASVADKAIMDGNGRNIAETYETKVNVKSITDEIRGIASSASDRASVAINASADALNRVNRGVQSINASYTSGAGSIGSFYLTVNFVGGGSESYNITEAMRGLINDVLTYDR